MEDLFLLLLFIAALAGFFSFALFCEWLFTCIRTRTTKRKQHRL